MLRNTFFAVLTVLATAVSSQAAIMLQSSEGTMLDNGLVSFTVSGMSTAGEIINGINNPSVVAAGTGAGVHQVWQPLLGATPTQGDHNPLAFNAAWREYDSFWFFDTTNSLSVGGGFTETNNESGGATGLPDGGAGPARTGFGTMGFTPPSASKGFTIASGRQGASVDFGQLVLKQGEQAMVTLGVLDNSGGNTMISNFMVGGGGGPEIAPVADDLDLGERIQGAIISHLFTTSDGTPPITWGDLEIVGPAPATAPTLTSDGNFSWNSHNSPFGVYTFNATASNDFGTDTGSLTVELVIPEPATMTLFGLAMIGLVGFARRRS